MSDPEDLFDAVGGVSSPSKETEGKLTLVHSDEIERLREELTRADAKWRDWESAHQAQKERADVDAERIEELEDENTQLKQGYTAIRNDMSRLSRESRAHIERLKEALLKVKENVENEGWCPICDEHTCREGYCILAELEVVGDE